MRYRLVISLPLALFFTLGCVTDAFAERFHLSRSGFITDFLILGPLQDDDADDRGWQETLDLAHLDRDGFWAATSASAEATDHHPVVLHQSVRLDRRRWNDRISERARSRFVESRWEHIGGSGPEIDLEFEDTRRAIAFLYAELEVTAPVDGWLLLGCDDDLAVWLDGERLAVPPFPGWMTRDQHWVPISLPPGRHFLLFKTYNTRGRWAVAVRLLDSSLTPPTSVRVVLPGLDVSAADLLERVVADLTPAVDDSSLVFEFEIDLPISRPETAGTVCLSSSGEERRRCLPVEGVMAAPRRFRVEAPVQGLFERTELALSYYSAGATAERVIPFEVLPHTEAVAAVLRGRDTLALIRSGQLSADLALGSEESFAYEIERLEELIARRDGDLRYLGRMADTVLGLASQFRDGNDPYRNRRGHHYRAYRGAIDGRLQPYAVYVPEGFTPDGSYPLVVSLHGLRSPIMMNLRQVLGYDREEDEAVEHAIRNFPDDIDVGRAVFVSPYGYGDTLFRFMGELDVLSTLEEARSVFHTDPRRTYLTGLSMGGNGSFDFSVHFPDQFAAVLSLAGSADMRRYTEFRRHPSYSWELALADEYGAMAYAVNAGNLPVFAVHGREDGTHYSHSSLFIERLAELGYTTDLETPDLEHNVWRTTYAEDGLLQRLSEFRRATFPSEVHLATPSYRYASSHWARIDGLTRVHQFGSVDAQFRRLRGGRLLEVSTSQINGLTLLLDTAPSRWREEPLTVVIDDAQVCLDDCWRVIHLRSSSQGDEWFETADFGEALGGKRLGLAGPIRDAWYGPMVLVYGTLDPTLAPFLRRLAFLERGLNRRTDVELPVVADVDVTPSLIATHHLVLYGTSSSNSVLADLRDQLPIDTRGDSVVLGDQIVRGDNLTAIFVYPNPLNPDRYVVVMSGTSPQALDALRWAPRFLPDFIVYGGEIRANMLDQRTFRGQPVTAGGFFDDSWGLLEPSEWLHPTPAD